MILATTRNLCSLAIFLSTLILAGCKSSRRPELDTVHPKTEEKNISQEKAAPLKFTEAQTKKLQDALTIATASYNDSLFERLVRSRTYSWDNGRLDSVPESGRKDPVTYFLNLFRTRGLPTMQNFNPRNDYASTSTTGSTIPCSTTINFNVKNLDLSARTPVYVAGTIMHERVHSFCFKHLSNNGTKQENLCDFAYHVGHIAIVIALYRANNSQPIDKPLDYMCDDLVKNLREQNIITK